MPKPTRNAVMGSLAICLAASLWGLDGVVLTPRLGNLQVAFVVFLLHAVPFVLMQPVLYRSYGNLIKMPRSAWLSLIAVALTGGLIGTLAIVKALFLVEFQRLSVVVLLQKLQPIFAIVLAAVLLGERISARFAGWAVVAVVGAYGLTFGLSTPDLSADPRTAHAALWAVVAAAAFGSATVLGKRLLGELDQWSATFGRYGATSMLAAAWLAATRVGMPFGSVTTSNWLLILVIGLTTGSGAIALYYAGLKRVRASVATICELCLPLSAVLFDYLVNGSILGPWQWVGAALLVVAIVRISLVDVSASA